MLLEANPVSYVTLIAAVVVFLGIFWAVLLSRQFKRCPSNKLLVVFGQGVQGGMHVQHGGAWLVWPLIQGFAYLSLEPLTVALPAASVFTRESIRATVKGDFVCAIGTSPHLMRAAAERLLGLDLAALRRVGEDESAAALRELAGQLSVEMMHRDRDRLGEELKLMLDDRLARYGMQAISVRIGEISDEGGVIAGLEREEKERLAERERDDLAYRQKREREEAEFAAKRAKAEAELEERHRREIEEEQRKRGAPADVLKEDPGDALKNM